MIKKLILEKRIERRSSQSLLLVLLLMVFCSSCDVFSGRESESPFPEAERQDMDGHQLGRAFDRVANVADLQGLAVARNGVLVAERYFNGAHSGPDQDVHVMSVTKSITSTLVGIAIDRGFLTSVEQTIEGILGAEVDTINPELADVTIHQLLTMSVGHDWHEIGDESEFSDWVNAPDQLMYILEKPLVDEPGTVFNYSDGAAHLISAILATSTGMDISDFANRYLFEPIGIDDRFWYSDNRGLSYGGVGLCIGIHDMIKIGNLYLDNGRYNGEQVISSDWIDEAFSYQIGTGNMGNSMPLLSGYGYYWWLGESGRYNYFCANGYGGQFIVIVPVLDLVVASRTSYRDRSRTQAGENWYEVLDVIVNEIIPSARQ